MNAYFADLHIHIGRTIHGDPVKITASDELTLTNIVDHAAYQKGLDMVGVIDSHVPAVQSEILQLIEEGKAEELSGGGIRYGPLTLILGCEVEVYDEYCQGPLHVLCYFPTLEAMQRFTVWQSERVTNITLSSQRMYGSAQELQRFVKDEGGIFIPAHIFIPFKSLYGKGVKTSLEEVFDPKLIDGVELGLSADTNMAEGIPELAAYSFVTNSDAHSLPKIAREYQEILMEDCCFQELVFALHEQDGRRIIGNYGMNPLLGKYYTTVCHMCLKSPEQCLCEEAVMVKGVADRIHELSDEYEGRRKRPPYIHQIPLEYLPKIGPKTLRKLIEAFGTEMTIIHHTSINQLKDVVPLSVAEMIVKNRSGDVSVDAGGGGMYGRIKVRK
ncbi:MULTISPECIES: endonuclease Q family protein [Pontibacillus]|uniref:Endonuclease Q family protein n=1 Tax=Pontibacillus chungwhensis TaxID=265426 RepID=A0ABY8UUN9_9BACI|nr:MULTISPECIES: endonuclease Q family protein [Pontibacillus]MCD5323075.1 endonuclease Q family protein [Pontibacillus sp. HN14]WIF96466.1 endonuclease Q family protein [Pontibacillus chungwhensis]